MSKIDLEQIQDSPHLLDLMLQMEDVLDTLDIYVFKNWFKGEVVEGPTIRRYWLQFTLQYPYDLMPDPRAGYRLLKHGVRVKFNEINRGDTENEEEIEKFWLIEISIPRRLISQLSSTELDVYDDEVDAEDVIDAKDLGMDDDESGYNQEDNEEMAPPQ